MILAGDDGGLAQGNGCGGGEKWSDSEDTLKVNTREVADGLYIGFEMKEIRTIQLHDLSN